jgi:epoxide hydrolase
MTSSDGSTVSDTSIEQFRIDIPQGDLDDLRERLERTRWPDELPGSAWDYGVPLEYLQGLTSYWLTGYDWRQHEERLNQLPQFTTEIDGAGVHFIHVRSPEPDAMPLLILHGWPGSVVELERLVGPLTDPRAHGGDPNQAFHVVAPSLPGYGFSGPIPAQGWGRRRTTAAIAELMSRLGYERYGAHGGDWGGAISRELGLVDSEHVIGVHLTMLLSAAATADDADAGDVEVTRSLAAGERYENELAGYAVLQATRPQTLSYALTDSPVGQLAWIVEKFKDWTDSDESPEDAVDRDQLLTNVMIYWLTRTAASSARLYYETAHVDGGWGQPDPPSTTPTGVAVLPRDLGLPVRRIAERDNNILQWTALERGGHFPAMEVPGPLTADIRSFFDLVR